MENKQSLLEKFTKKTQIEFYNINRASLIVFLSRYYNNETSYLFVNETELSNFQKSQPLNEQHIYTKNTAELKSFVCNVENRDRIRILKDALNT